jgi:hypothetical protein
MMLAPLGIDGEADNEGPLDFQSWVAKRGFLVMVKGLPILSFHTIEDQPSVISFPPEVFERGMAKLHKKGYQTIGLTKVIDYLRQKRPFPE